MHDILPIAIGDPLTYARVRYHTVLDKGIVAIGSVPITRSIILL